MNDARGILALWNDCAKGGEDLYERWYHEEHFSDRVSIEGFRLGRRHEAVDAKSRFFTYYETDSAEVLVSPAYLRQLDNPSPLTRQIMDGVFINASRTVCTRIQRIGAERASFVVAVRSPVIEAETLLSGYLDTLRNRSGVVRLELWRPANIGADGATGHGPRQEEQIRGPDQQIGICLVIHATRQEVAENILRCLPVSGQQDLDIGLYRLLCELRHEDCKA
tara:strand:- start:58 stop:723 length:666 start_codon:yes stop_codon:yes gene_type:complete